MGSSLLMLLAGWLVRHYELHSTVPSQLLASFTHMEHKVPHPALSAPPSLAASPCPPSLWLSLSGHRVVSAHCARRLHRAGCGILRAVAAPLLAGNRREHVRHTESPSHAYTHRQTHEQLYRSSPGSSPQRARSGWCVGLTPRRCAGRAQATRTGPAAASTSSAGAASASVYAAVSLSLCGRTEVPNPDRQRDRETEVAPSPDGRLREPACKEPAPCCCVWLRASSPPWSQPRRATQRHRETEGHQVSLPHMMFRNVLQPWAAGVPPTRERRSFGERQAPKGPRARVVRCFAAPDTQMHSCRHRAQA